MKHIRYLIIPIICLCIFSVDHFSVKRAEIVSKYTSIRPTRWGMFIPGVKTHIKTDSKVIALTFDGCGGPKGSLFDKELISYLISEKIPATLFLTDSWINANEGNLKEIANNPLFELENHGLRHKPASVKGACAWHIRGTLNAGDCFDEAEKCALAFEHRFGHRPKFYRSGTAYYDDVAIKIIRETGQIPMNFSCVVADADHILTLKRVENNIRRGIKNGAVLIMHLNHPGGKTLPALKEMIPEIKAKGYSFVRLSDMESNLE